ncbi:MAG: hypothetical protein AAF346_16510 [Pseudomonadota bacterium]
MRPKGNGRSSRLHAGAVRSVQGVDHKHQEDILEGVGPAQCIARFAVGRHIGRVYRDDGGTHYITIDRELALGRWQELSEAHGHLMSKLRVKACVGGPQDLALFSDRRNQSDLFSFGSAVA